VSNEQVFPGASPIPAPCETPAISAAAIQVILFEIAFKITSCRFIIRSSSAALIVPGLVTPQVFRHLQDRTTHL
jgi:hypothetical protein